MITSKPFIILEGPDCVGKTTLGRFLTAHFNAFYYHATAKGKLVDAMMDYQSNILDNVESAIDREQAVVLDRHWPSETVYGPVFRPGNPNGFDSTQHAARIKKLKGIYVFGDREDVIEAHRAKQDVDHPYDEEPFARVVHGYRALCQTLMDAGLPVLVYNIHQHGENMRDFAQLITIKHHELTSR